MATMSAIRKLWIDQRGSSLHPCRESFLVWGLYLTNLFDLLDGQILVVASEKSIPHLLITFYDWLQVISKGYKINAVDHNGANSQKKSRSALTCNFPRSYHLRVHAITWTPCNNTPSLCKNTPCFWHLTGFGWVFATTPCFWPFGNKGVFLHGIHVIVYRNQYFVVGIRKDCNAFGALELGSSILPLLVLKTQFSESWTLKSHAVSTNNIESIILLGMDWGWVFWLIRLQFRYASGRGIPRFRRRHSRDQQRIVNISQSYIPKSGE